MLLKYILKQSCTEIHQKFQSKKQENISNGIPHQIKISNQGL
jgi:uncharacterized membrane protein YukC